MKAKAFALLMMAMVVCVSVQAAPLTTPGRHAVTTHTSELSGTWSWVAELIKEWVQGRT